jgi:hypothetical protein
VATAVNKDLEEVLVKHQRTRHPRAHTDFAIACTCGWEFIASPEDLENADFDEEDEPTILLVGLFAAHVATQILETGWSPE